MYKTETTKLVFTPEKETFTVGELAEITDFLRNSDYHESIPVHFNMDENGNPISASIETEES